MSTHPLHPLQYAFCGRGRVFNSEDLTDLEIQTKTNNPGLPVERYNRCHTCEQWSPCAVRRSGRWAGYAKYKLCKTCGALKGYPCENMTVRRGGRHVRYNATPHDGREKE